MTKEITEDDKLYKMGIDPYEEDVPGKEGTSFHTTLAEKWLSKSPKEMQILFGAESAKKFIEALDEEFTRQLKGNVKIVNNTTKKQRNGKQTKNL